MFIPTSSHRWLWTVGPISSVSPWSRSVVMATSFTPLKSISFCWIHPDRPMPRRSGSCRWVSRPAAIRNSKLKSGCTAKTVSWANGNFGIADRDVFIWPMQSVLRWPLTWHGSRPTLIRRVITVSTMTLLRGTRLFEFWAFNTRRSVQQTGLNCLTTHSLWLGRSHYAMLCLLAGLPVDMTFLVSAGPVCWMRPYRWRWVLIWSMRRNICPGQQLCNISGNWIRFCHSARLAGPFIVSSATSSHPCTAYWAGAPKHPTSRGREIDFHQWNSSLMTFVECCVITVCCSGRY